MSNQPTDPTPRISVSATILLAVSVLAGTILAGLIAAQAITGVKVYVGTAGFFGGVMSVGGIGFIIQLAAEKIMRRIDQLEAKLDEQCEDRVASAFVGHVASGRHLSTVKQG